MSDESKERSWAWIGWVLVAALVVYPLSIGPAAGLSSTDLFNESLLPTIYLPLRETGRVDCIGNFTVAYINLFMNTTEREAGRGWDNRPGIGWGRGIPFDHEMEQMPPPPRSNLQPPLHD